MCKGMGEGKRVLGVGEKLQEPTSRSSVRVDSYELCGVQLFHLFLY